jgi:hypothetical protein
MNKKCIFRRLLKLHNFVFFLHDNIIILQFSVATFGISFKIIVVQLYTEATERSTVVGGDDNARWPRNLCLFFIFLSALSLCWMPANQKHLSLAKFITWYHNLYLCGQKGWPTAGEYMEVPWRGKCKNSTQMCTRSISRVSPQILQINFVVAHRNLEPPPNPSFYHYGLCTYQQYVLGLFYDT